MCFNPMITWATAGLGFATCLFAVMKRKPATLYFAPAYFGSMEVFQGIMYTQLLHPSTLIAQLCIYLAYINVCFQPLVFNYWLGTFLRPEDKVVYRFTLKLCFVGGLLLLARMLYSHTVPLCSLYESLCSATPTIFYGAHHIAWSLPLVGAGWNYLTPSIALHMFLFFIPGLILGLYRLMLLFFIFGPYLSSFITSNASEQSSIWCVIGLWLLVITVFCCIRKPPTFFMKKA